MTKEISVDDLAKSIAALTAVVSQITTSATVKSTSPGKGKKGSQQSNPELKAERMAANDAECIKVFTAAGYKNVKPRVNVLTYKKWLAEGRKVIEDQKGYKVGPFNLFHIDQTEPISTAN